MRRTYLKVVLLDIHKPGRLHPLPLQIILQNRKRPPNHLPPFHKELAPLPQRRVVGNGAVVALDNGGGLETLDPAAGAARLVGLVEEGGPIGDGAQEPAHVDVVG